MASDITFIPTAASFLYLPVVLDAWSRRIVSWCMAKHLRAELVLDALEMAIGQRRLRDVIHHSDQGSQYTSLAFGNRCREAGVRPSMGSVGDAYDKPYARASSPALSASCSIDAASFRRLRPAWPSSPSSKAYHSVRLHSSLGYRSPLRYEQEMLRDP